MRGRSDAFSRRLLCWFDMHQRALPWRLPRNSCASAKPDPFHVLVSETMLQQTQVATVIPYFQRFIARFPTAAQLASASGQDVLKLWQGLGYYSRARNLQAAAQRIVDEFGGEVPSTVDELLSLSGVGRYTAGAVASIAFAVRAPILDGNVARVICRLDCIADDPRAPATRERLWSRAEELVPKSRPGDFNAALMELGALICTPRSPRCLLCPVRAHCQALAAGMQEQVPMRRKTRPTPLHRRWVFCIRHGTQYLLEQRPSRGRWAGMWQFITVEAGRTQPSSDLIEKQCLLRTDTPRRIGKVTHSLTHRRYEFDVFSCAATRAATQPVSPTRKWLTLKQIDALPLSRPQLKLLALLEPPK